MGLPPFSSFFQRLYLSHKLIELIYSRMCDINVKRVCILGCAGLYNFHSMLSIQSLTSFNPLSLVLILSPLSICYSSFYLPVLTLNPFFFNLRYPFLFSFPNSPSSHFPISISAWALATYISEIQAPGSMFPTKERKQEERFETKSRKWNGKGRTR